MSTNILGDPEALRELWCGPLADLVVKLTGKDGPRWEQALKRMLHSSLEVANFKTWRMIKLHTDIKDADGFREALKKVTCGIGNLGNDILGKPAFTMSREEKVLELVVTSNVELGFPGGAKVKQTYARAKELGLELCPSEVGPQLCLQYTDQPKGEWLLIAMEPITDSGGNLNVFYVECRDVGRQWLDGCDGGPDSFWRGPYRWVFVRGNCPRI
jgi:hypothetical protein